MASNPAKEFFRAISQNIVLDPTASLIVFVVTHFLQAGENAELGKLSRGFPFVEEHLD
jgi:hypothetical protein